jgi:hypothetical protein
MRDWKAIAKASGIEIDSVEPLEALEAAFRPLLKDLTPGVEPATE